MERIIQETGKCFNCDWKGKTLGKSSGGDNILCERFSSTKIVQEVENCSGWTFKTRHPNESVAEFESRQSANRLDTNRYQLAARAHKRSILAIIIASCALLVSIIKLIFELFIEKAS